MAYAFDRRLKAVETPRPPRKPVLPPSLRATYRLSPEECERFHALSHWPREGIAMKFWQGVAAARGLDCTTIIGDVEKPYSFSAMPMGHGKHWCFPDPLKVPPAPKAYLMEVPRDGR